MIRTLSMIKKYLWITVLIFGFISCEEAPNEFTTEANAFLKAIDGKKYNGTAGTEWEGSTFEANGTLIAEHRKDGKQTQALVFQNTKNNGTSATEAIYRFRIKTDAGTIDYGDYVGIIRDDSGDNLRRTLPADSEANISWTTAKEFATKQ